MNSPQRKRRVIAITGGIGCGKSTAARCFENRGWERLDADDFVHREVFPMPEVHTAARRLFGEAAIRDGSIDRHHLGQQVFGRPELLAAWEAEIHPRLFQRWERHFEAPTEVPLMVEVPLLFEKGLEKGFDFVVCVSTSSDLQLARLEERGLKRALAEQRISRQWPLRRKMDLSHFVLSNDGSPSFLQAQVDHLSRVLVVRQ